MSKQMLRRGALAMLQRYAEGGPTRVELDPSRYFNYGEQGGEHEFFPGRMIPGVGPFAKPSGMAPGPNTNPKSGLGDYIPLLGMTALVGKDLYDWWKKKNPGQTLTPEIAATLDAASRDTSQNDAYVNQQLDEYGQKMPMPWINDDGSVSHIGGGNFWDSMDSAARTFPRSEEHTSELQSPI